MPEIDPETGKPVKSDAKSALTLTAFVVAAALSLVQVVAMRQEHDCTTQMNTTPSQRPRR